MDEIMEALLKESGMTESEIKQAFREAQDKVKEHQSDMSAEVFAKIDGSHLKKVIVKGNNHAAAVATLLLVRSMLEQLPVEDKIPFVLELSGLTIDAMEAAENEN